MVKAKPAKVPASGPSAKRLKKSHSKATATAKEERKTVDPTSLAWSTVHLPSEAQAGGAGVTQSDFFNSLSWDDDDFMGLQEIDDVDVLQETRPDGSRTISFKAADKKIKNKQKKATPTAAPPVEPKKETKQKQKQKAKQAKKRSFDEVGSDAELEATPEEAEAVGETSFDVEEEEAGSDAYETANDLTMLAADDPDSDLDDEDLAAAFRNAHQLDLQDNDEDDDAEFDDSLLPAWAHLPLHPALKRALAHKGFTHPTEIQNRSLPLALGVQPAPSSDEDSEDNTTSASSIPKKRDVVGISQTGSGKTLAYGLPILNYLFENSENTIASSSHTTTFDDEVPPPLGALILCPTRELALQVSSHLTDLIKSSCLSDDEEISHKKLLRRPQIAVVCGGMSEQKQRRLLEGRSKKAGVDIIVATPGRLWEMTRLDDHLAARIKQTRFLVLDEADRMVEVGHFAEMEHILNLVNRAEGVRPSEGQDGQESDEKGEIETLGVKPNANMQTFVFSATLSKALQVNLKKRRKVKQFTKKRHYKRKENATTLDELMDRIDFRSTPAVIDLTPGQGLPEGLMETKIECVGKDKDLYLYYFLLRYPGRSLVFVNSIDGIRRLTPILTHLNITTYPIHSQLQQKQRLKNLDRFRTFNPRSGKSSNCVLLATDVAARGLDIPSVEHVVHYQLPRSADTYVHRSGRTARAGSSGVSLALIEPKEKKLWLSLCRTLGRKSDISTFPITFSTLSALRERVELALSIDKATHEASKAAHDDSWLAQLAEEADLMMSDEDVDPDAPQARSKDRGGKAKARVAEMKGRLEGLLSRPVTNVGLSHRYLTATGLKGSEWVDDMLRERGHEGILGERATGAGEELAARQQQGKKKKVKVAKEEEGAKQPPAPGKQNGVKGEKGQKRKLKK